MPRVAACGSSSLCLRASGGRATAPARHSAPKRRIPSPATHTIQGIAGTSQRPIWCPSSTNGNRALADRESKSRRAARPNAAKATARTGREDGKNPSGTAAKAKRKTRKRKKTGEAARPSTRNNNPLSPSLRANGRPVSQRAIPDGASSSNHPLAGPSGSRSTLWPAAANRSDGDNNDTSAGPDGVPAERRTGRRTWPSLRNRPLARMDAAGTTWISGRVRLTVIQSSSTRAVKPRTGRIP